MSSVVIDWAPGQPPLPATVYPAAPARATGLLFVFAHGAGAGQSSPFMTRFAGHLAARGIDVVTFDFPYMAGRKKVPDRMPVLEQAFLAMGAGAVPVVRARPLAMFVGGKSMGGRIATHLAAQPERWTAEVPLAGAVAFGYPLRPPGARGGDRVSHLRRLGVPLLVVQGTRDTFGGPDDLRLAAPDVPRMRIVAVETGDHSLKVLASAKPPQAEVEGAVSDEVARWMVDVAAGGPTAAPGR